MRGHRQKAALRCDRRWDSRLALAPEREVDETLVESAAAIESLRCSEQSVRATTLSHRVRLSIGSPKVRHYAGGDTTNDSV